MTALPRNHTAPLTKSLSEFRKRPARAVMLFSHGVV